MLEDGESRLEVSLQHLPSYRSLRELCVCVETGLRRGERQQRLLLPGLAPVLLVLVIPRQAAPRDQRGGTVPPCA